MSDRTTPRVDDGMLKLLAQLRGARDYALGQTHRIEVVLLGRNLNTAIITIERLNLENASLRAERETLAGIVRDAAERGIEEIDHRPFGIDYLCRECDAGSFSRQSIWHRKDCTVGRAVEWAQGADG